MSSPGPAITEATATHTTVTEPGLDAFAAAATCPGCGKTGFDVTWRLIEQPKGTYSIAGVQEKFVATSTPVLVCSSGCGTEKVGKRP
jgi:hypothetical protein